MGAVCIAFSAPLVTLSQTNAATASVFRCLLCLPVLIPLAVREGRRAGAHPRRQHVFAGLAGALFGADLLLWSQAIGEVGAGVATVIVNLQVLLVPLLALLVDRPAGSATQLAAAGGMRLGPGVSPGGVLAQHD